MPQQVGSNDVYVRQVMTGKVGPASTVPGKPVQSQHGRSARIAELNSMQNSHSGNSAAEGRQGWPVLGSLAATVGSLDGMLGSLAAMLGSLDVVGALSHGRACIDLWPVHVPRSRPRGRSLPPRRRSGRGRHFGRTWLALDRVASPSVTGLRISSR